MAALVLTQQRDYIFEVILNRPDKRNAISFAMLKELEAAFDLAEKTPGVRVVFLRAEGRVFSSGIDLEEFTEAGEIFGENWRQNLFPMTALYQLVANKIERCSHPVIALLHGFVLGMALEFALACDFRIVAERTRLGLPESMLGIIPDVGGTTRLLRLAGPARAKEIVMTGRNFDTADAERWGIVSAVVPRDELVARAEVLAEELKAAAPLAVSYAKRVINDIMENDRALQIEAWAQAQLMRTEDFEAVLEATRTKDYNLRWKGR